MQKMYLEEPLSASQIAEKLDVSKTYVLQTLWRYGIERNPHQSHLTNPNNYRHWTAPIGYKVHEGKLVLHQSEVKICRLVVRLARSGLPFYRIAQELVARKIKNRKGKVSWGHHTIGRIYKNWNEKL